LLLRNSMTFTDWISIMNMLLIRSPSRWLLRAACAILATLGFAVLPASGADDGFEPGVLPLKRVADVPLGGRPSRCFLPPRHYA
jgi:hypothetical protein